MSLVTCHVSHVRCHDHDCVVILNSIKIHALRISECNLSPFFAQKRYPCRNNAITTKQPLTETILAQSLPPFLPSFNPTIKKISRTKQIYMSAWEQLALSNKVVDYVLKVYLAWRLKGLKVRYTSLDSKLVLLTFPSIAQTVTIPINITINQS